MADIAVSTSSQLTAALLSSVPGDRIVVDKTADLIAPSGGWVGGVKTGFTFDEPDHHHYVRKHRDPRNR
jgi:hypothetical protein